MIAMPAWAAAISDGQAASHVGQTSTVCGKVASVYTSRRGATFLDFGADYPIESFTAVIFGSARAGFGQLGGLRGQQVCVTGSIDLYRGRPEMILRQPGQLKQGL
ncbi:MAG: hypothetical protein ACREFN_01620 [Acetobacteraceae bacterium]